MLGLLMALEDDNDRELAESIWRTYENRIYNFAFSLLRNTEDAEDVQMTVIVRIIQNIDKFRDLPYEDVTALVYTYTKNASITLYNQKKHEFPTEMEINDTSFGLEKIENEIIEDEKVNKLKKLITSLPENYTNVLILCCVMGMKTGEVAKSLGITRQAAYSRLNHAKALLRKEYEKLKNENGEKNEK